MNGYQLSAYLMENCAVSSTTLSALLGVTWPKLLSWDFLSAEQLRQDPKGVRLLRLHRVVKFASDYGVTPEVMVNFLHENPDSNENGPSLLFSAVYEKGDLAGPLRKAIERWKESK